MRQRFPFITPVAGIVVGCALTFALHVIAIAVLIGMYWVSYPLFGQSSLYLDQLTGRFAYFFWGYQFIYRGPVTLLALRRGRRYVVIGLVIGIAITAVFSGIFSYNAVQLRTFD